MKAVFEKKAIVFAGIILISALISGCGEFLDMSVSAGGTEKEETDAAKGFGQYEITDRDRDTMESGALEINLDEPEDEMCIRDSSLAGSCFWHPSSLGFSPFTGIFPALRWKDLPLLSCCS